MAFVAASDLPQKKCLSSGCESIDELLKGGFYSGMIFEVFGEAGCGKTQLALQLLVQSCMPSSSGGLESPAICIYSEGTFPVRRLREICEHSVRDRGGSVTAVMNRIYVEEVQSSKDLVTAVVDRLPILARRVHPALIVVDSIAAPLRSEFDADKLSDRADLLFALAAALKRLADELPAVVVVANQAVDNMVALTPQPALGLSWAHCVNARIQILKSPLRGADGVTSLRRCCVVFAPHLPRAETEFGISSQGIVDLGGGVLFEEDPPENESRI
jgi:RecA/RadA recombinase